MDAHNLFEYQGCSTALARKGDPQTSKDAGQNPILIPLTQGKYATVDEEDYERISKHKWYAEWNKDTKSFYAIRQSRDKEGKQYKIRMAREILGLNKGDKRQADHKDHNTLDNRTLNLRVATRSQNQWNRKNTKGYSWHRVYKNFQAEIMLNGKSIFLGRFPTSTEAHIAYLNAKKKYHKIKGNRRNDD